MNDNSIAGQQIKSLKQKLESSVSSRKELEKEFDSQSAILMKFIAKLSLSCKGLDKELDIRLAELRKILSKKPSLEKLEPLLDKTSKSLTQYEAKADSLLGNSHSLLSNAASSLQKLSGLPNQLRRDLRDLIARNAQPLDSVPSYVPELIELIELYNNLVKSLNKSNDKTETHAQNKQYNAYQQKAALLSGVSSEAKTDSSKLDSDIPKDIIEKFSKLLSDIILSEKQESRLSKLKSKITSNLSSVEFINTVIDTFELVIDDLKDERQTAENFLYTLNDALSSVETAVKNTLKSTVGDHKEHKTLNDQLKKHLTDMSTAVGAATSLEELKSDINSKLSFIVDSIERKSELETNQKERLEAELTQMVAKIEGLEKQTADYEKRLREQKLKSMQDALTKLPNRAAFDEHLSVEMTKWEQENFELAVIVLDLDHFKQINDTYGHTAGDKTLQVIANTLKKFANEDTFVGRFGGEEFVIVLNNRNQKQAIALMNKLRLAVSKLPFKFKKQSVSITISVGITHIKPGDNMHIAFERADEALYEAKNQGRNRVIYK